MNNEERLIIIEKDEIKEAMDAANQEANATFKNVIQVVIFRQGSREYTSGSLPIGRAVQMMKTDPVKLKKNEKAGLDDVRDAYNRPVDKEHVKAVANYLCKNVNKKYILPALTVNAVQQHKAFTIKSDNDAPRIGYLVVDFNSQSLTVTDGQHRLHGMIEAIDQLAEAERYDDADKLRNDGISIMFSFEEDINQIHQDFADCSKTKALPKSMIAVYDQRIPVNRLTLDIIDKCPLFNNGKVDSASASHGAKSTAVVLASNIRAILKGFYCAQPSMADSAFDKMTNEGLEEDCIYEKFLNKTLKFMDILIENNPALKAISLLPKGPERQLIPQLRSEFYIASPAGLNLCATFIKNLEDDGYSQQEIEEAIKDMASFINWEKSSPMWQGNVITGGIDKKKSEAQGEDVYKYAINSTNKAVKEAIKKIREELSLPERNIQAVLNID